MDQKISVGTLKISFTPFALRKISEGFYKAAENYDSERDTFLVNLFLYGASIEIGLKSAILNKDNSDTKKRMVRYRIGHDLKKCIREFNKLYENQNIITNDDMIFISKLNKYYKNKGLEYCTGDIIFALANGGKDFPELSKIEEINTKIIDFMRQLQF